MKMHKRKLNTKELDKALIELCKAFNRYEEMKISQQAAKEIMELSESESLKKDIDALRRQRYIHS